MKTKSIFIALFTVITYSSFATSESEIADKSRQMVEKSADWKTLADAAKLCFTTSTNTAEAVLWLGQSLSLTENAYNLKIKADFLAAHQMKQDALATYIQAMSAGLKENVKFDVKELQTKIVNLKTQDKI